MAKREESARTRTKREKFEAAAAEIRDNPIREQIVWSASGPPLGTVTPEDDGTWWACRYGPGYPDNAILVADEAAAVFYVSQGQELADGPKEHPAMEALRKAQEAASDEFFRKAEARRSKKPGRER